MTMSHKEFSLILPCYNEAEHFLVSAEQIVNECLRTRMSFEIIFIDDKSTDETSRLIDKFIKTHKNISLRKIQHFQNKGRGATVSEGFLKADSRIVGYMDIDCEISPRYLREFVGAVRSGNDVVCAHRHYDVSAFGVLRALSSKLYSILVRLMLNTELIDTEAGYKFFDRKKIIKVLPKIRNKRWFWDTEVMILSERFGLKIKFLPVQFLRRRDKTSTVNLWSDTLEYIKNLLRFRRELNQFSNPTHEGKISEMHFYWEKKSAAFSNQYQTIFGLPISPVGIFLELRHKAIKKILEQLPGKTFLDVGCGSGVFLREALIQGRFAVGVDYSGQMLEQSMENLSQFKKNKYKLVRGNATELPVKNKSVEILLASGLTDYLSFTQTESFMREINRVVIKGGYAIITFPKKDSILRFLRSGIGLLIRRKVLLLPPMATSYSLSEVKSLCKTAHLVPQRWQDILGTMRIVVAKKI